MAVVIAVPHFVRRYPNVNPALSRSLGRQCLSCPSIDGPGACHPGRRILCRLILRSCVFRGVPCGLSEKAACYQVALRVVTEVFSCPFLRVDFLLFWHVLPLPVPVPMPLSLSLPSRG